MNRTRSMSPPNCMETSGAPGVYTQNMATVRTSVAGPGIIEYVRKPSDLGVPAARQ